MKVYQFSFDGSNAWSDGVICVVENDSALALATAVAYLKNLKLGNRTASLKLEHSYEYVTPKPGDVIDFNPGEYD